jgi:hypothetical protein
MLEVENDQKKVQLYIHITNTTRTAPRAAAYIIIEKDTRTNMGHHQKPS